MLSLYYTGATTYLNSQSLASNSKGGYLSNSLVQNGLNGNIFSDISLSQILEKKKVKQYIGIIGIFSEKEREQDIQKNITFELANFPEEYKDKINLYIGIGPLGGDTESGIYMEKLANSASRPFHLQKEFVDLTKEENFSVSCSSLSQGLAIWLGREINLDGIIDISPKSPYWEEHEQLESIEINFDIKISEEDVENTPELPEEI